tara:strand:+ start:2728 stop:2922 length:195 start_codon:yes stop_codon:yes gene_type:complete
VNVNLIKEHENGDATYQFDLTNEEAQSLLTFGILEAIKAGIREGDRLTVEGDELENISNPGLSD